MMNKTEEASVSTTAPAPEAAPTYGSHIADQIILQNSPLPAHSSILDGMTDIPTSSSSTEIATATQTFPPQTPFPKSMVIDKDLIFPSEPPATALYSLNFTLQSRGMQIMISRSVPSTQRADGSRGKVVDKPLYELTRPPLDYKTFHIRGQRKSTYPGTGELKLVPGLQHAKWDLRFGNTLALKCRNGVWTDGNGKMVAREDVMLDGKAGVDIKKQAKIDMEDGLEEITRDLIVAAWCARIWWIESKANSVKLMSTSDKIRHRLKSGSNVLS